MQALAVIMSTGYILSGIAAHFAYKEFSFRMKSAFVQLWRQASVPIRYRDVQIIIPFPIMHALLSYAFSKTFHIKIIKLLTFNY